MSRRMALRESLHRLAFDPVLAQPPERASTSLTFSDTFHSDIFLLTRRGRVHEHNPIIIVAGSFSPLKSSSRRAQKWTERECWPSARGMAPQNLYNRNKSQ